MTYLLATALTLVNACWACLVLLGLPGTWLMVITTVLVAWWRWEPQRPAAEQMFGPAALILWASLAVLAELLEFAAGVFGARRAGGSRSGAIGALIGTLIGGIAGTVLIPVPLIGSLLGACLGAAAGAWLMELRAGRALRPAVRSGIGAGLGRLGGTAAKFAVALIMWVIATIAAFWP